jgi:hypothetical protein
MIGVLMGLNAIGVFGFLRRAHLDHMASADLALTDWIADLRIVLGKGGGDESGDDVPTALAGMSQRVAHEVDEATLPGAVEHLGEIGIDTLVSVGHAQLDATRAATEVWPLLVESAARP